MRRHDYSEHHNHESIKHDIVIKRPKKIRPFFLKPFFLIPFILVILIAVAIFSPIFSIKKIIITGTNNTEIINFVERNTKNFLNSQKIANIFIFSKNNLIKKISDSEKIEDIKINSKFPNTLIIQITQKIPAFIWQEGDKYFLIDNSGVVTTPIILSQNEWNLPIVSGATTTAFNINDNLVNADMVNFIKQFNQELNKSKIDMALSRYIIPDLNGRELRVETKDGWQIFLLTGNSINKIFENLKFLLETKFKDQKPKNYIDLRIEDRIFYK
jgi:cell division septal protein FtsQ